MHYHDQAFDFFIGLKSGQYASTSSASGGSSKTGSSSSKGAPDDFSLDASINFEGLSHLEGELVAKLKVAKGDVDSRIGVWTAKVKAWQDKEKPKITANKAKIAARRASLEKAFTNVRGEQGRRGGEVVWGVVCCVAVLWLLCTVIMQ